MPRNSGVTGRGRRRRRGTRRTGHWRRRASRPSRRPTLRRSRSLRPLRRWAKSTTRCGPSPIQRGPGAGHRANVGPAPSPWCRLRTRIRARSRRPRGHPRSRARGPSNERRCRGVKPARARHPVVARQEPAGRRGPRRAARRSASSAPQQGMFPSACFLLSCTLPLSGSDAFLPRLSMSPCRPDRSASARQGPQDGEVHDAKHGAAAAPERGGSDGGGDRR